MASENASDCNWMASVEVMLGSLDHGEVQVCCISRVPNVLLVPKEESFKPKLVSIGPLHKGTTRNLVLMEETKWRYMKDFLNRQDSTNPLASTPESRLRRCSRDILRMDTVIRACYGGDMIELQPHELSKIMIVDGCFQLELLLRLADFMDKINNSNNNNNTGFSGDPLLETEEKVICVLNDMSMLENQVPLAVLKKLYRKVFPDGSSIGDDHRVANIVRKAFGYPSMNQSAVAHVVQLMHSSTVQKEQGQPDKSKLRQAGQELGRCTARLLAAGITIKVKPANTSNNPANGNAIAMNESKFVDRFDFDMSFSDDNLVLKIPAQYIKETTEVRWRNLIAWEQSRIWVRGKYTTYACFFQGLICCEHDIELLEKIGVIVNESKKSKEELLNMFRTISKGTEQMDSSYSELCLRLNSHSATRLNRVLYEYPMIGWHLFLFALEIVVYYSKNWYKVLRREHIPTIWKFIGVVAAVILLVLTILQTYYSAASYYLSARS